MARSENAFREALAVFVPSEAVTVTAPEKEKRIFAVPSFPIVPVALSVPLETVTVRPYKPVSAVFTSIRLYSPLVSSSALYVA